MRRHLIAAICIVVLIYTGCSQTTDPLLSSDSLVPLDLYFSSGDDGTRYYHLQIRKNGKSFSATETITDNYSGLNDRDSLAVLSNAQIKMIKSFLTETMSTDFSYCDRLISLKENLVIDYEKHHISIDKYCPTEGRHYIELRYWLFHNHK